MVIIIIALDFIPVKFAVSLSNELYKEGIYICSHEQVTGGNWRVENYEEEQLYFEYLKGNSPFNFLSEIFCTDHIERSGNIYLLSGTIETRENQIYDLQVDEWDIAYPISRKSIRMLYVPKNYLTIYDYNLIKIIKHFLHQ